MPVTAKPAHRPAPWLRVGATAVALALGGSTWMVPQPTWAAPTAAAPGDESTAAEPPGPKPSTTPSDAAPSEAAPVDEAPDDELATAPADDDEATADDDDDDDDDDEGASDDAASDDETGDDETDDDETADDGTVDDGTQDDSTAAPTTTVEPLRPMQTAAWWTMFGAFAVGTTAGVLSGLAERQEDRATRLSTLFDSQTGAQPRYADRQDEYEQYLRRGDAFAKAAIGVGVVAGAATIAAITLFAIDARRQRAERAPRTALRLGPGSLQVRF